MCNHIRMALAIGLTLWLGSNVSATAGPDRIELEKRVKAQINERMYDCCHAVVLTEKEAGVYEGFVQYVNGMRSGLEVTISDMGIEYTFTRRPPSVDSRQQPGTDDIRQLRARLEELERLTRQQEAQIARLRDLCQRAGIDPEPHSADPLPGRAPEPSLADANDTVLAEAQEPPMPFIEGPVFTSSMYTQIQKGMAYRQVADALGAEGELISTSYFDGATNEVYIWANPDDSHICVVFRDGAALVKAQSGLPGISSLSPP